MKQLTKKGESPEVFLAQAKPGTQARWVSEKGILYCLSSKQQKHTALASHTKLSHPTTKELEVMTHSTRGSQQISTACQCLGNNNNSNNKNINAKEKKVT